MLMLLVLGPHLENLQSIPISSFWGYFATNKLKIREINTILNYQ